MNARTFTQVYRSLVGLLVGVIVALTPALVSAQSSEGTEFWLSFTPNIGGGANDSLSLAIASKTGATVTVTASPGSESTDALFVQNLTLAPNEQKIVVFPNTLQLDKDKKHLIDRNSIHVVADAPIAVYGRNLSPATSDGYLGLPKSVLGRDYYLVSFTGLGTWMPHAKVIATEDNTAVTFTPSGLGKTSDGTVIAKGGSRTLTLQQGETALFYADGTDSVEISGSRIVSSKPIAVIAGNACSYVPVGVTACDHLDEMLPPVTALGQNYILVPTRRAVPGDIVRIVAVADDTAVFRAGVLFGTLSKGEMYEFLLDSPSELKLNRPALVAQFLRGANISGYPGDPAEMLAIPTAQFLSSYQIATFQEPPVLPETMASIRFKENYLNVIIPTGALSTLKIDGVAVDASKFFPVPGTNFSWAALPVALGPHGIEAAVPFGLYAYGLGEYESYAVPGGMAVRTIYDTSDPYPPNARLVQVGSEMRGLATDSSDTNANGLLDPDEQIWGATIGPRSEDTNMNNQLDAGEDVNGNGRLDRDLGIKRIELELGASNLELMVTPFVEGGGAVSFVVRRIDPNKDGLGNVLITDLSGNSTAVPIGLVNSTTIHNVRVIEILSKDNIELDLTSFATQPSGLHEYSDRYEIEWFYPVASTLTEIDLGYDVIFKKPQFGETRVVNRRLTLDYEDSVGNPVHYEVGPQSVQVMNIALDVLAALDKSKYLVGENGTLTVDLKNLGLVSFYGAPLCGQLRDRDGIAVGAAFTLYSESLAVGAVKTLTRSLALSNYMVGQYDLKLDVYRNLCNVGEILKSIVVPFSIVDSPGLVAVDSSLKLDRAVYRPVDKVLVDTLVRNLHPQSLADGYGLRVQIVRPDGTSLAPQTRAVPNLVPLNQWSSNWTFGLQGEAPGIYAVISQLLDGHGGVVDTRSAKFSVQSSADSGFGLAGKLALPADPIRLGASIVISPTIINRGNAAFANLPLTVRIVNPATSTELAQLDTTVVALPTNEQRVVDLPWQVQGQVGDKLFVVLVATVGNKTIALAQETITVQAAADGGTTTSQLTLDKASYNATDLATIKSQVINQSANVILENLTLTVSVTDAAGKTVFTQDSAIAQLPAAATREFSNAYAFTRAAPGSYTVTQVLKTNGGAVLDTQSKTYQVQSSTDTGFGLAGSLGATPKPVAIGASVSLAFTAANQGNAAYTALPLIVRIVNPATSTVVAEFPASIDLAAGGSHAGSQTWTAQGAVGDTLIGVLVATVAGKEIALAQDGFTLAAGQATVKLDLAQRIAHHARLLVLAACSGHGEGNEPDRDDRHDSGNDHDHHAVVSRPGQTTPASCDHSGDGHDDSGDDDNHRDKKCGLGRAQTIDALLNGLAIAHRVTTDPALFRQELRTGAYNAYWISGQTSKLKDDLAEELREAAWRGEGLLLDGVHDQRNKALDAAAGIDWHGKQGKQNQILWLNPPTFSQPSLPTLGRTLKAAAAGAEVAGRLGSLSGTPAVFANPYGNGRVMLFGVDLVASLPADPAWPGTVNEALAWLVPPASSTWTPGGYLPVTTTVTNIGAVTTDVQLNMTLPTGTTFIDSSPAPTQPPAGTPPVAMWQFSLGQGQSQTVDLALRAPADPGTLDLTTLLSTRTGTADFAPYGEPLHLSLAIVGAVSQLVTTEATMATLPVTSNADKSRRKKATDKVEDARKAIAKAKWNDAIGALIDAIDQLTAIATAPAGSVTSLRLALDQALKEVEWRSVGH